MPTTLPVFPDVSRGTRGGFSARGSLAAFAAFSGCIRRLPPFLLFFSSKAPFISSMLAPPVSSDLPDRDFPASRFSIPQFVRKRITIW
jgi:uncharacterized membrane protein